MVKGELAAIFQVGGIVASRDEVMKKHETEESVCLGHGRVWTELRWGWV